nr:NAD(+)/NADH kinase [bacterium]
MRKVLVFVNPDRDIGLKVCRQLAGVLLEAGVQPVMEAEAGRLLGLDGVALVQEPFLQQDYQAVFVLGGDGTILSCVKRMGSRLMPIIGINLGHVGFLTQVEPWDIKQAVAHFCRGEYTVDRRMMLEIALGDGTGERLLALNDMVIKREDFSHVTRLRLSVSGQALGEYVADGVVISTPTGSTAYALSAGGPVMAPNMQGMVLVPICAHSLFARPVVLSDGETLQVTTMQEGCSLAVDGIIVCRLEQGQSVTIRRAACSMPFISFGESPFYPRLMRKLSDWASPGALGSKEDKHDEK